MPSRTLEDQVEELTKLTAALSTNVQNLQREIQDVAAGVVETDKALADLKTMVALLAQQVEELKNWKNQLQFLDEQKVEVALLRREVTELKTWREGWQRQREEWSRKLWMILPPVLAALLSSLLTGWIAYLLK